jgi:AbrB family looped-hinge helix DNA binding protein
MACSTIHIVKHLIFVQRSFRIFGMEEKAEIVTLSKKYQVVIPKSARKKLGLTNGEGQRFRVERVSKDEIVFRKDKTLDSFLGQYGQAFPENATEELRKLRDRDWE